MKRGRDRAGEVVDERHDTTVRTPAPQGLKRPRASASPSRPATTVIARAGRRFRSVARAHCGGTNSLADDERLTVPAGGPAPSRRVARPPAGVPTVDDAPCGRQRPGEREPDPASPASPPGGRGLPWAAPRPGPAISPPAAPAPAGK